MSGRKRINIVLSVSQYSESFPKSEIYGLTAQLRRAAVSIPANIAEGFRKRTVNMNRYNIVLYLCNWGPHAAFQALQDRCADIPAEIRMIRIPCTGRISKSLLFKPFEMGVDGVALVGCKPGTCRYGFGTETARANTEDTRDILELLGLSNQRLQLATFLPEEADALLRFMKNFTDQIRTLGPSPVTFSGNGKEDVSRSVSDIVAAHDVYACQDCGKCSSACPLALAGKPFSPRALAGAVIAGETDSPAVRDGIWACLTCGLCYDRCPSAVNFPEFIRDIRHYLVSAGHNGHQSHGGFFHSLMRTMTEPELKPRHWSHLPGDIRTDPESKVLFFGGCAPYYDTYFSNTLGVKTLDILFDSLRLLNFFDVFPAVLDQERCCGHDLLWTGDRENFIKLAGLNAELLMDHGIEQVITACPECYHTLFCDYPASGIEVPFTVTHIYDFLKTEIGKGAVAFKEDRHRLTYQDSCRLSRFANRPDLPRSLINRLKPEGFFEMQDRSGAAICCGNTGWTGCDAYSKALQVGRLRQARATGSDLMITSCPKCQIHLKCAMEDPFFGQELKIKTMDLVSLIARTIYWE